MTPALLRVYDPAECDAHGVPLDWERCRTCAGTGRARAREIGRIDTDEGSYYLGPADLGAALNGPCEVCDGRGSLKAAALDERVRNIHGEALARGTTAWRSFEDREDTAVRCEGCGHPMSAGEWDGRNPFSPDWAVVRQAYVSLRRGSEPDQRRVHWSACDAGCRHPGPVRFRLTGTTEWGHLGASEFDGSVREGFRHAWHTVGIVLEGERDGGTYQAQASWRAVDVRVGMVAKRAGLDPTAGPLIARPFDLRSENVALLCLRCWAERNES